MKGVSSTTALVTALLGASTLASPIKQHAFLADDEQQPGMVSSAGLQNVVEARRLESRANELYAIAQRSIDKYGNPTRVIGSPGHHGTLDYIQEALHDFGGEYYDIWTQKFDAVSGKVSKYEVKVDDKALENVKAFALTPPTPHNKPVTGRHFAAASKNGCDASDFGANVNGSVVLVQRGECPFGVKSANAGKAGAVACIVYNNVGHDEVISGTLSDPSEYHVATFGVSKDQGAKLLELGNDHTVSVWMDAMVENVETYNVLAETKNGDHDNVVMLGAHSDSVAEGPGINDDGSGTISLLEVAKGLTLFNTTNAVRFAWWAAEEEGLVGSDYFADHLSNEENQKVRLFMDYDMMASPNYAYQVYDANNNDHPNGSGDLKQLYIDFYQSQGVNYTLVPFDGRSDYDGFIRNGIPAGGVATGADELKTEKGVELFGGKAGIQLDPCYHLLCDGLDNPDYDAWVINTKLIAHSVAVYGQSLENFPKREPATTNVGAKKSSPTD